MKWVDRVVFLKDGKGWVFWIFLFCSSFDASRCVWDTCRVVQVLSRVFGELKKEKN